MLPGELLAPRRAFPESYQETAQDPAPVVAFQADFVQGGLLLDCAAQHNFVDMSGIEQCFSLLVTALRGESFSLEAIAHGNLDRRNLVSHLPEHEDLLNHSQFRRPDANNLPPPPLEPVSPFLLALLSFLAAEACGAEETGDTT